jgi:hypothetical protein
MFIQSLKQLHIQKIFELRLSKYNIIFKLNTCYQIYT